MNASSIHTGKNAPNRTNEGAPRSVQPLIMAAMSTRVSTPARSLTDCKIGPLRLYARDVRLVASLILPGCVSHGMDVSCACIMQEPGADGRITGAAVSLV